MFYTYADTPIGRLMLVGDEDGLTEIVFPEGASAREPDADWTRSDRPFAEARRQLDEYFAGRRRDFDLALRPDGTKFQLLVLAELRRIPYGETATYAEIARRIGKPRAVRAVGAANGRNPLPIVIPCHRVIGSDGSLVGFGGGLEAKAALLRLESEHSGLFARG
ncbi:MAG: methylated-DNA--[protein]-cysteine S-methyltransferase [Woeseiaceae bacterium]|nr:methylated-DNA--[protein]-cysteine S-methyltransferase [Woeseiaceae bacterium]